MNSSTVNNNNNNEADLHGEHPPMIGVPSLKVSNVRFFELINGLKTCLLFKLNRLVSAVKFLFSPKS